MSPYRQVGAHQGLPVVRPVRSTCVGDGRASHPMMPLRARHMGVAWSGAARRS